MENSGKLERDAARWFIGGLIGAAALTSFLIFADDTLTNSPDRDRRAQEMSELRTAQAALGHGLIDPRTQSHATHRSDDSGSDSHGH